MSNEKSEGTAEIQPTSKWPSHTRYWVVVFAVTLAIIQYVDRICISKSQKEIQHDLKFDDPEMGWILSIFALAYALFEIPSGWLGDRFGPRKALIRVVLWWSFFTILTGWMNGFWSMLIVRFLFGAGEAGCFPNLTRAFVNWLQPAERVRAQSILWLSARWGGALTPPLVYFVMEALKGANLAQAWRYSFLVFGIPGLIWTLVFALWFRDNPKDHPKVNEAEKELLAPNAKYATAHGKVPWGLFVSSGSAWLLWAQYFLVTYVWYFYVTGLSKYLDETYGMDAATGLAGLYTKKYLSVIAGIPLFMGGFGCLISGFITKRLAAKMGLRAARRLLASLGLLGTCLSLVFIAWSDLSTLSPLTLGFAFGMASMCSDFTMPCSWGACMDVGGRVAGTFSGSMNMMGNFAGFLSPYVAYNSVKFSGVFNTATGLALNKWNFVFWTMALAALAGAICWRFIDPVSSLDGGPAEEHAETFVPKDEPASRIEEL